MLKIKYLRLTSLFILLFFIAVLTILSGCSGDRLESGLYPGEADLDIDFDKVKGMASGSIDSIKADSDTLILGGWAVSDYHLLINPEYYVFLESGEQNRFFEAELVFGTPEEVITDYSGPDEDFAAFQVTIEQEAVNPGFYKLGILIVDGENLAAVSTDSYLMNGEEYLSEDAYLTLEEEQAEARVYLGIDSFKVEEDFLVITGWGFLDGISTADMERNLLLRMGGDVKTFPTSNLTKERVIQAFAYKGLNLENAGFKAEIPLTDLEDGDYQVGLYIAAEGREGIGYQNLMIRDQARLLSRQFDLTIDEDDLDGYIWFHFDRIEIEESHLLVRGWSFLTDMHAYGIKHYVLLKGNDEILNYGVETQIRPDVTEHFSEWQGTNLDQSGFSARIPLEDLKPGQYEIGLYAEVAGIKDSLFTMRFITID